MPLHVPSLLAFGSVQLLLLLAVSLPVWRTSGFGRSGFIASIGVLLAFGALPLMALRSVLPDFVTFALANSMMLIGMQLVYQIGYSLFGLADLPRWDRTLAFAAVVTVCVMTLLNPDPGAVWFAKLRVLVCAVPMGLTAACWLVRLRRSAPRPWTLGTRYLVVAGGIAATIHGLRAIAFTFSTNGPIDPLKSPIAIIAILGLLSSSLLTAFGFILHMESTARDRLRRANDELSKVAFTDTLTGLGNRRQLEVAALQELPRALDHGWPVTLMLLDVDHFKRVNDRWGHGAGDVVLREVASACRVGLRNHDVLVRWGGEEFALMLPQCTLENAEKVARRILQGLRATAIPAIDGTNVTVSIGIATVNVAALDLTAALIQADAALYRAKQGGRDRYEIADGQTRGARLSVLAHIA